MLAIKAILSSLAMFSAQLTYAWTVDFKPYEKAITKDLEPTTNGIFWTVSSACALMAIYLYILSGYKLAKGDNVGSGASFVGAILIALAPFIARDFIK